jgi:TolB-like protein/Flp pilus assembly protein TadD
MFTDMVGYTALGQRKESLALALVEEQRKLVRPVLERHRGREVKTMGDAFLVEFPNSLDAIRCAYDIQRTVREFNIGVPEESRVQLRVGVHLGDVVESGGDVSGDAVNVASRIEPLSVDGGVCLTRSVYEAVEGKFELPIVSMGEKSLKNVLRPMEVFRVEMPWETRTEPATLEGRRVAVLPLANMSPDPNDEYFSDGLTEELISTLSKIGGLKVISRTSVMQYKGRPKSVREIAKELGAGTILEGSVRKVGNRVRVTVQMIDGTNDMHLWSESYDRDLQDVFAIQSNVAQQVAAALRVQLLASEKKDIERKPTQSMDAYQLYLQGLYYLNREAREDTAMGLRYLQEAIGLDQRFALAYAAISEYYHGGSHSNWFSPEEAFPKMKEYAMKALEIDPNLAEGHASLGAVYFHYEWKWDEAEKEFARAIELRPSYDGAYIMYYYLLAVMGRFEESYEIAKRGSEYSPQFGTRGWGWYVGSALLRLGRTEEGVSRLEQLAREDPELGTIHFLLGLAYYKASRMTDAISETRRAVALSRGDLSFKGDLGLLLAIDGQKEEATSILEELEEASKVRYVSNVQLACILYCLGRADEAFENLEKAYQRRAIDLPDIRTNLAMERLRKDPRWATIETRMGLWNP